PEVQTSGQVGHQLYEVDPMPPSVGLPERGGLGYQEMIDHFINEDTPPPPPVPADAAAVARDFLAAAERGEI
ncbi:unnamed protein product, partial [marine sediment metagenome]